MYNYTDMCKEVTREAGSKWWEKGTDGDREKTKSSIIMSRTLPLRRGEFFSQYFKGNIVTDRDSVKRVKQDWSKRLVCDFKDYTYFIYIV